MRSKPKDAFALVSCAHYTALSLHIMIWQGTGGGERGTFSLWVAAVPSAPPTPSWFVELVKQHFGLCPLHEVKVS